MYLYTSHPGIEYSHTHFHSLLQSYSKVDDYSLKEELVIIMEICFTGTLIFISISLGL